MNGFLRSVIACVVLLPAVVVAQESKSAAPARKLAALMAEQHLDFVAARDSTRADQFIAALLFQDSQLLVVSARPDASAALQGLLDQKAYNQVYAALQGARDPSGQVFFQDLKADGLDTGHDGSVDVMYEKGTQQTIFDDEWRKQNKLGEAAFMQKFNAADELYSHLLSELGATLSARGTGK